MVEATVTRQGHYMPPTFDQSYTQPIELAAAHNVIRILIVVKYYSSRQELFFSFKYPIPHDYNIHFGS